MTITKIADGRFLPTGVVFASTKCRPKYNLCSYWEFPVLPPSPTIIDQRSEPKVFALHDRCSSLNPFQMRAVVFTFICSEGKKLKCLLWHVDKCEISVSIYVFSLGWETVNHTQFLRGQSPERRGRGRRCQHLEPRPRGRPRAAFPPLAVGPD